MKKNIVMVWLVSMVALSITLFIFHVNSSAQSILATKIFQFQPFTAKCGLKSEFVVITRAQGSSCLKPSEANKGRSNAYKCTASTLNLDPCFTDDKILACFVSPWNKKVVVIEPEQPIAKKSTIINIRQMPWAIELSNGLQCSFLGGPDTNIHDQRVNYYCSRNIYVVGDVDQSKPVWHAKVYNSQTGAIKYLPIVNAWY